MLAFLLTEFESFIPSDLNTSIHNTLKIARPSIWWSLLIFIFQLVFRGSVGDQLTGGAGFCRHTRLLAWADGSVVFVNGK